MNQSSDRDMTSKVSIILPVYNGEMYIPGKYESFANPAITLIPKEPNDVIPNAIWGGDRIMGGLFRPYAWKEYMAEHGDPADP